MSDPLDSKLRSDRDLPVSACDADRWARDFFGRLLAQQLPTAEFDAAVDEHWSSGRFIRRAPECAAWMRSIALQQGVDARYGSAAAPGFRSQWLVGAPGLPGAIHIQAPQERLRSHRLADKNRRPHRHDSARVSLITQGHAILHLLRPDAQGRPMRLDCPVVEGDLIFWPAWITHTFDARDGFWLVSAMSCFVSPAVDGFALEPDPAQGDMDALVARAWPGAGDPELSR